MIVNEKNVHESPVTKTIMCLRCLEKGSGMPDVT